MFEKIIFAIKRAPVSLVYGLLFLYQKIISPLLAINGAHCRFYPTCSCYAKDAVREYGIIKGGAKTLFRLLRCHRWGGCGYDPVIKTKVLK